MPAPPKAVLPAGFLLGVATSGFQVEGGYNGLGEPANNWVDWERQGRVEPSGIACDFWRHPEEALDRVAAIGAGALRMSVEWARIEPEPGEIDERALARYGQILAGCAGRGITPVVTLHHFTHPAWLGPEFWLTPGSPDRFAAHVERVVPALAKWCRHWVTVNEPNIVALMGWITGAHPPGRKMAVGDALVVVDNLLAAHVLAYRVIHRHQPDAEVTVNTGASTVYEHDRLLTDLLVAPSLGVGPDELDSWVDGRRARHDEMVPARGPLERGIRRLFAAASPYGTRGRRLGRRGARFESPRRVVEVLDPPGEPPPLDASGIDWYDPVASHALRIPGHLGAGGRRWSVERALWDQRPDPAGLGQWCAGQHLVVPGRPVWVVENGMATLVRRGRSHPRLDGWDRPAYLRAHLAAVLDAVHEGVPVTAYLHWSLVDNYEWGSYEPRMGLFGMDRARGDRGVRWLDTDAQGADAPGAFRRLADALRSGDLSEPKGLLDRR